MDDRQFLELKNILRGIYSRKSLDLEQENNKLWKEIISGEFIFDRYDQYVGALAEINKMELIQHFDKMFFDSNSRRLDFTLTSSKHDKDRQ